MKYDVIVVGAGLSGLVATAEMAEAGKWVLLLDQEPESSIGGQAWWSFGGLFLVDSPEQRRLGIRDSRELAWQDWLGAAGFDREEDEDLWGRKWAEAYVDLAAGEKRAWLHSLEFGSSQSLAGRNAADISPRATAIPCRVFTLCGEQGQVSYNHLSPGSETPSVPA